MSFRQLAAAMCLSCSPLVLATTALAQNLDVGATAPGELVELTTDARYDTIDVGINDLWPIGALTVSGGATITVDGFEMFGASVNVGVAYQTTGTLVVSGTGSTLDVSGNSLRIGQSGVGSLILRDGATLLARQLFVGDFVEDATSSALIEGDGTSVTISGSSGSLKIGDGGGPGEFTIRNGATVSLTGPYSLFGVEAGSELTISGPGTTVTATATDSSVAISNGTATFSDGATVRSRKGYVGNSATGSATLTVTGAGTSWAVTDALTIAGINGSNDGNTASMFVLDGASVTAGSAFVGMDTTGTGLVTLSGEASTLEVTGDLTIGYKGNGSVVLADGAILDVGGDIILGENTGSTGKLFIGSQAGDPARAAGTVTADRVVFGDGTVSRITFNHAEDNYDFGVALSGSGTIIHFAGNTTLSGDASDFEGTLYLNGGQVNIDSDFAQVSITASGGTLSGSGTLHGATLDTGTIHSIAGDEIGTQTVLNSYTNDGTLLIDIDANGSDQLIVGDAYSLYGTRLQLRANGDLDGQILGKDYVIIDGLGTSAAHFVAFAASSQPFLDYTITNTGEGSRDTTLRLTRNATSFASIGVTANQRSVAAGIESATDSAAYNLVALSADEDAARETYEQLSGEVHADLQSGLVANSRFVRDALNQRLLARVQAGDAGAELAFWPGADLPFDDLLAAPSAELWGTLYGGRSRLEGDAQSAGLTSLSGGLLMGIEASQGDWLVGLSAGVGGQTHETDSGAEGRSTDLQVGAYAGTSMGATSLHLGGNLAVHGIHTSRVVTVGGIDETLTGDYAGLTGQLFGELGQDIDLGGARLTPFAGATYIGTLTTAFSESGGSMALDVAAEGSNTLLTVLGLRSQADLQLGELPVTLSSMLGWQHALGDINGSSSNSFGGSSFTVSGTGIAEDALLFDLGLSAELAPNSTVSTGYRGEFSETGKSETLFGRFQQAF